MKLTIKQDEVNVKSLITKHDILVKASSLVMGREGALETEKELYLMMAFVDTFLEEDLIEECNKDSRTLNEIVIEDIEPIYMRLIEVEDNRQLYKEAKALLFNRCKEIWDNQHSVVGVIDALLTTIANMSPEDTKDVLESTAKVAEKAFERRTEIMEHKADETNSKLEQLVRQYQKQEGQLKSKELEENKQENDAE